MSRDAIECFVCVGREIISLLNADSRAGEVVHSSAHSISHMCYGESDQRVKNMVWCLALLYEVLIKST